MTAPRQPQTPISLGELPIDVERLGTSWWAGLPAVAIPDPLTASPDPSAVAVLLPEFEAAARELRALLTEAAKAIAEHDRMASSDFHAETRRRATLGLEPDAIETLPARLRAARLTAAIAAERTYMGGHRWAALVRELDLGKAARSQVDADAITSVLGALKEAAPVIEHLEQLNDTRQWIADMRLTGVKYMTDRPVPSGRLTGALRGLQVALTAAVADDADDAAPGTE